MRLKLEITNACNLTCKFCVIEEKEHNLITEDIVRWALHESGKYSAIHSVTLHGGEPTLYPDLIIKLTKLILSYNKTLQVIIATNGTLLTDYLIDNLLKIGKYRTCFIVGVDGYEEHTNILRGNPDKVIDGIVRTIEKDMGVMVGYVVNPFNYDRIYDMTKFLSILGIYIIAYTFIKDFKNKYTLTDEMKRIATEQVEQSRKDFPNIIIELNTTFFDEDGRGCKGNVLNILADGTVTPCSTVRTPIGKFPGDAIEDIFAHPLWEYLNTAPGNCRERTQLYQKELKKAIIPRII